MSVRLIKSCRGKNLLVFNDFTFYKDKELKNGECYWRCVKKTAKCGAKVFTMGEDLTVVRSDSVHNHAANKDKLNAKIVSNSCKRKAEEDISEKPSKIIRRVLSSNIPETVTTNDIRNIRRNIYHSRRKVLPFRLPTDINEVHNTVEVYSPKTCKEENFVFINNVEHNIIVFSCNTNIQCLLSMDALYMDGTFSYTTKFFLQLFTIHGLKNGHYVPLLFCLLPNKNFDSYKNLFCLIQSKISADFSINFYPAKITVDFEKAIHKAIFYIWPETTINGCRFHLHQAWYRKIQALGLCNAYKDKNSETGKWIKHTFGLTYLEPKEVEDCFVFDLMSYKPENELLNKYADYLLETYIQQEATFPPILWAEQTSSITRTSNACESFHAKFNSSFYSTHPSLYVFVEKLKEFQIDTYIKIQSLNIFPKIKDKSVKAKVKMMENLINKYRTGQLNRLQYIKCMAYL